MTEPRNSLLVLFAGERGFKCARAARSLVYVLCFMFGLAVGAGSLEFAVCSVRLHCCFSFQNAFRFLLSLVLSCSVWHVMSPGRRSSLSPLEVAISLPLGLISPSFHTPVTKHILSCSLFATHHFPAGLNHCGLYMHLISIPLPG